jgi:hypothetical protein
MKHTKGPWVIEKAETGIPYSLIYPASNDICPIARITNGTECDANAHLIAAAPEMLEALIQARGLIVQLCNDVKNNYGLDLDVNGLLRARGIDDVINKAKGESK